MTDTTHIEAADTMRLEDADPMREADVQAHPDANEEHRPSPRDDAMAEIARRRREAIDRELRMGEDFADEARRSAGLEPLPHEQGEDPTEAAAETPPAPAPGPVAERPAERPALRTIEIDGQTFQVTDAQMAELAQLGARTNVAMQRHQMAAQQAQQPAPPHPQVQAQSRPAAAQQRPGVLSKEDAEAVADRLLYGGKEQVTQTVQALAEHLVQQARGQQVSPDAIAAEATRRALEQQQLYADLTTISQEYPEIWSNRALGELAAVQLGHVRAEDQALGVRRSNLDSYREAANRVMDALGKPRPGSQPTAQAAPAAPRPAPTDRNAVLERKRAAPAQPSAIDRRASGNAQTVRARTGSEIVAAMRKARGQMSMT